MTPTKQTYATTTLLWLLLLLSNLANNHQFAIAADMPCELQCSNGGYCTLIDGTPLRLSKQVQSGVLIETCVCPPGYGGVACEIPLEQCTFPDYKCHHNGLPCTQQQDDGEYVCDCELADAVSDFAGHMCRNPYTEYCSGKFEGKTVSRTFCTNGGRCKSDFIAANIAPGDTTVNKDYKNAGCVCPPEFSGPHCEYINTSVQTLPKDETSTTTGSNGNGSGSNHFPPESQLEPMTIGILLAIIAICSLCACAIVVRRRSHRLHSLKRVNNLVEEEDMDHRFLDELPGEQQQQQRKQQQQHPFLDRVIGIPDDRNDDGKMYNVSFAQPPEPPAEEGAPASTRSLLLI